MKLFLIISPIFLIFFACGDHKPNEDSTLTLFAGGIGEASYQADSLVMKKSASLTGIRLENIASQNTSDERKSFNLMLSSGKFVDILRNSDSYILEKLGADGLLIDLKDLVKQHAPNIKAAWDEYPILKKIPTSVDGSIYYIPYHQAALQNSGSIIYFIRIDWLDIVGLKEPTTIEEYYQVLKAFKTKDPNRNGKQDEIPFFVRSYTPNLVNQVILVLLDIFQVKYGWDYTDEGVIVYTVLSDKYKNAIKELAKWYKEGLIDPEIFSRGGNAREYVFGNNLGGMTIDWASTGNYMEILKDKVPSFNLKVILPPKISNKVITFNSRILDLGGWGITKFAKDPIGIIKYFDFWFSSEGRRLWNFGVEGSHYTLIDGKPIFTDLVLKNPDGLHPLLVLRKGGAQTAIGGVWQDYEYERQITHPIVIQGYELYKEKQAVKMELPRLKYIEKEQQEFTKIDTQLRDYADEMSQKWIMGAADIDKDWGTFTNRLLSIGANRVLELQQKAYNNFIKE